MPRIRISNFTFLPEKWLVLIGFIWIVSSGSLFGQDPVFSQYFLTPTYTNSAFTGLTEAARINTNYRHQFPSFGVAFRTFIVSADKRWDEFNSGIGINVLVDDAGDGILKNNSIGLTYAYILKLSAGYTLRLGMDFSLHQLRLDRNKLLFGDQLDPLTGIILNDGVPVASTDLIDRDSRIYPTTGFGVAFNSQSFFLGYTMHNLNSPDGSFLERVEDGDIPIRISFQAGYFVSLRNIGFSNSHASLNPLILFSSQKGARQLNVGAIIHSNIFQMGLFYRQSKSTSDAIILSAGLEKGIFRVSYSYDYTVSGLSGATGGTHELGLLINLEKADGYKKESIYNDCLSIFK